MTRPRKPPIPLTIVAGPLGAGKTTLINRMIRDPAFANTAVILNEFGKTNIENALVEQVKDGLIALGGGCVCCAGGSELADALERLLRELDNQRIAALGRVIVESDASADPAAIYASVALHPYLSLRFRSDGIVAVGGGGSSGDLPRPALRQLAMADVIALADPERDGALLAAFNPFAAVVYAATAAPAVFTGHGLFDPGATDVDRWLGSHQGSSAAGINAFTVVHERPMPLSALDRFLDFLAALRGPDLIRVRAVVATEDGDGVVVEGLGGLFWPPVVVAGAGADGRARFSVVATNLDREGFDSYLAAFLNEARIDTPDRQALTENPLAIAGFSARSGR